MGGVGSVDEVAASQIGLVLAICRICNRNRQIKSRIAPLGKDFASLEIRKMVFDPITHISDIDKFDERKTKKLLPILKVHLYLLRLDNKSANLHIP
jgi:hypothetical protein